MTRLVLLPVLVWVTASGAWADVPSRPRPPVCRADADCVLSNFKGCCAFECCPSGPRAWLASDLARAEAGCGVRECAARPECPPTPCAPRDGRGLVAVCEAGQCVARAAGQGDESFRSDPDWCGRDEECVSSTFAGCCGSCCPVAPRAVTRRRAALEGLECSTVHCGDRNCSDRACAQVVPAPIRPICRANRCVAQRTNELPVPPPALECRVDGDCGVDQSPPPQDACWDAPCGCCPVARVVPQRQVRPPPTRRQLPQGTPFGLSPGGAAQPTCGPCPQPPPVTPRCEAGRCVGTPPRR
ncbi:MAG: hypothetical protein SFW67_33630 [Myxococcaceae bacterium]|nr:hypothetical protein [Myxococcaceae bacterium]